MKIRKSACKNDALIEIEDREERDPDKPLCRRLER